MFRWVLVGLWLGLMGILPFRVYAVEQKVQPQEWQIKGALAALEDEIPEVRVRALKKLEEFAQVPQDKVPQLIEFLKDDHSDVRRATAQTLGELQAKEATQELVRLLKDDNPYVREAAAQALAQLQAKEATQELIRLLKDDNSDVRRVAAQALGQLQAKEASQELIRLLKDDHSDVRRATAQTLGQLQAKEATQELVRLLKDDDSDVRRAAAQALGQLQAKEASQELIRLLKDDNPYVREAAAQALGQLQAKEATQELVRLLKDDNPYVRRATAQALGQRQAKEATQELISLLKDDNSDVRRAAAQTLGRLQAKEATQELISLLKDDNSDVLRAAAQTLGRLQAKEAIQELVRLLKDDEFYVLVIAAKTLGQLQAKEATQKLVRLLKDENPYVRGIAAKTLGQLQAKEATQELVRLLKDDNPYVRQAAAQALGQLQAKEAIQELVRLLKDDNSGVREAAAQALSQLTDINLKHTPGILNPIYYNTSRTSELRFLAHFLGGGKPEIETLLKWLGEPGANKPQKLTYQQAQHTLQVFKATWPHTQPYPKLRDDLARQIAVVISQRKITWHQTDLPLLKTHFNNLDATTHAATLKNVLNTIETKHRLFQGFLIWFLHALFWLTLIILYPRFPQIQAIFFWNPWVRKLTGLGYVNFALTWVPSLRQKLFEPFRDILLADANLGEFEPGSYFRQAQVKRRHLSTTTALIDTLPDIHGQIVLEGESGLGKTWFIRYLLSRSQRISVYLPAEKCTHGIIPAIQTKLHGIAKDEKFLKNLIYSGALNIYIDGLNQVSADTRAQLTQFAESHFKGHILMATQPLEWTPPATATVYWLQPLKSEQIEEFLISRHPDLADYPNRCRAYLKQALNPNQLPDMHTAIQRILSNPMDATLVADMLAQNQTPDLFHLQAQQYALMAEDYQRIHLSKTFPLAEFSEQVYQMRLAAQLALPSDKFIDAITCMARFKMVLSRHTTDKGQVIQEWYFRHDKIMEFFIVQTFLGDHNPRPTQHFDDPRFRGVYFLLALLLPFHAAMSLREALIRYASQTQDHTISDTFIQLLYSRQAMEAQEQHIH